MRQLTFEEETSKGEEGDRKSGVVPQEAPPTKGPTLAKLDVSSTPRTPLQAWLAEKRRRDEREALFEKLLLDPAYLARVEAAAAELRACTECHAPGKVSP